MRARYTVRGAGKDLQRSAFLIAKAHGTRLVPINLDSHCRADAGSFPRMRLRANFSPDPEAADEVISGGG
jgi:hypothetical protein